MPFNPVAPTRFVRGKQINVESAQQNPLITHQNVQMALNQIQELDNMLNKEIPKIMVDMKMREREIENLKIICHEKDKKLIQMMADANQRETIAIEQAKENELLKTKLDEMQKQFRMK